MPNLTADEITEFRTDYIRDKYTASPLVTLSHYNRAAKANFFSGAQVEAIHDRIQTDGAEELDGVYDVKYTERLNDGDSDADAVTAATAQEKAALFRLMRAECWQVQMVDPGFVGSISDEKQRAELFKAWATAIERDRSFARTRTSAAFASVPVVRL